MDQDPNRAVLNKIAWRLLPFLFLLYVVNILDRSNISMAGLKRDELGLSKEDFGLVSGIFYLGYILFEVPSNLIMRRVGARRWMARIMIGWGLVTCFTMAARGLLPFCIMRILLGVAEAGFFPGIVLYMTAWFPSRQRARAVAFFMAANPITSMFGAPLSGGIMQGMDGVAGLQGWQWLFLLEGLPAVILGLITLAYLTDAPSEAGWLDDDEKDWLAAELAHEHTTRPETHSVTFTDALWDRRVWLLIALYFTAAVGANAYGFWAPQLIKSRFPDEEAFTIGLLAALPGCCATLAMIANAWHSDRTGERRFHIAVPALIAGFGLLCYVKFDTPAGTMAGLILAQSGINSMLPTFWALPPTFLRGRAAAGGIALINSIGNFGGFVGPNLIGMLKGKEPDSFATGLIAIAVTLGFGAVLALCVRKPPDTNEPFALNPESKTALN